MLLASVHASTARAERYGLAWTAASHCLHGVHHPSVLAACGRSCVVTGMEKTTDMNRADWLMLLTITLAVVALMMVRR